MGEAIAHDLPDPTKLRLIMTIWESEKPLNRRDAIRRIGITASAVALGGCAAQPGGAAVGAGSSAASRVTGAPIIRTILNDIDPATLTGPVLMHEHLSIHYPLTVPEHFTDDVELMTREARAAREDGVALIVDAGHADMARNLDALRRITTESGLPLVASGGYYMQRSYPSEIPGMTVNQIADVLVAEAGRDRLGAFGEIGQQGGVLTADERKVFEAVASAHVRTGLPVFTHNAYSGRRESAVPRDAALKQLEIFEAAGATLSNVAIGHVCCLDDPTAEIAIEIARRGAFVAFDRVTLNAIIPDADRVVMAKALIAAGHADKLLLSSDFYSANSLKSRGGSGLGQAATVFAPMLRDAGVPDATVHQILVDNPRRFLSFTPLM